MNAAAAGFLLGIGSSLHCVGMCGPLALAVPRSPDRQIGRLIYHAGRIATYGLLGFTFGGIGQSVGFVLGQQGLSVLAGAVLTALYLLPITGYKLPEGPLQKAGNYLRRRWRNVVTPGTYFSVALAGLLNGLLPCGAVYLALAASAVSSGWSGGLVMLSFGAGTLPALLALGSVPDLMGRFRLGSIRIPLHSFSVLAGLLLVLRGLNLGIPYISPERASSFSHNGGTIAASGCNNGAAVPTGLQCCKPATPSK